MKLLKNSFYSLGGKVINMVLNIGGMAILARLLTPNDFGIFAIILGVQILFQAILDMGLGPVYIKKQTLSTAFISSFFTINIFLGLLNILYLLGSIFILNNIYNDINFTNYMLLFLVSIFFTSYSLIYQFNLVKEEKFDKLFIANIFSNSISLIIAIIIGYLKFGVYALIVKAVVYSIINFIFLYIYNRHISFKLVSIKIINRYIKDIKFGVEIFFNRIINGIFQSLDRLIIAKFFSTSVVGNYNNAKNLALMSDSVVRTSLTSVAFSRLEKLKDIDRKSNYIKYYGTIFLISSIIPIVLYIWGDTIIIAWLGNQWVEASKYIKPLAIFALGHILKGIITMIAMHEQQMKSLNIYNIIVSMLELLIFISLLYLKVAIIDVLYVIAIYNLASWLIIILINLKKGAKNG